MEASCGIPNPSAAGTTPPRPATPQEPSGILADMFSIDLRALAACRVSVAFLILIDLINRAVYLRAHYTDQGILTRADWVRYQGNDWNLNIFLATGKPELVAALFVLTGFFAVCLLFGWRTRLMTVLCWVMMTSLQGRNSFVLNAGDAILGLLLLYGSLLPWGAAWSADRAMNRAPGPASKKYLGLPGAAILIQIASIYVFTAIIKLSGERWQSGEGIWYSLNLDSYAKPMAYVLMQFPGLLYILTHGVLLLELAGGILLFSPVQPAKFRTVLAACFFLMHIGFYFCLEVGMFPFVDMASLLLFLPSEFWDRAGRMLRPRTGEVTAWYDADCTFCKRTVLLLHTFLAVPGLTIRKAQDDPARFEEMQNEVSWILTDPYGKHFHRFDGVVELFRYSPLFFWLAPLLAFAPVAAVGDRAYKWTANNRPRMTRLTNFLHMQWRPEELRPRSGWICTLAAAALMTQAAWLNLDSVLDGQPMPAAIAKYLPRKDDGSLADTFDLPIPRLSRNMVSMLRSNQYWIMFRGPRVWDGWYVVDAELVDGEHVDLLRGGAPVTDDKPDVVSALYPNHRWRKVWINMQSEKKRYLLDDIVDYYVSEWDARQADANRRVYKIAVRFFKEYTKPGPDQKAVEEEEIFQRTAGPPRSYEVDIPVDEDEE